jgi:hypothetical protein
VYVVVRPDDTAKTAVDKDSIRAALSLSAKVSVMLVKEIRTVGVAKAANEPE